MQIIVRFKTVFWSLVVAAVLNLRISLDIYLFRIKVSGNLKLVILLDAQTMEKCTISQKRFKIVFISLNVLLFGW